MRKTWLAVLALALSAVPAVAQKADVQPLPHKATSLGSLWATNKQTDPPVVKVAAPPLAAPAPVVPPPPPGNCANNKCPSGKCTSGIGGGPHLRRALDWFCYQPLSGCCHERGNCGCHYPLYLFFIDECAEGRKYELPACCGPCDRPRTSMFRNLANRVCGLAAGLKRPAEPCNKGCSGVTSGHQMFASPTGHGVGGP